MLHMNALLSFGYFTTQGHLPRLLTPRDPLCEGKSLSQTHRLWTKALHDAPDQHILRIKCVVVFQLTLDMEKPFWDNKNADMLGLNNRRREIQWKIGYDTFYQGGGSIFIMRAFSRDTQYCCHPSPCNRKGKLNPIGKITQTYFYPHHSCQNTSRLVRRTCFCRLANIWFMSELAFRGWSAECLKRLEDIRSPQMWGVCSRRGEDTVGGETVCGLWLIVSD